MYDVDVTMSASTRDNYAAAMYELGGIRLALPKRDFHVAASIRGTALHGHDDHPGQGKVVSPLWG